MTTTHTHGDGPQPRMDLWRSAPDVFKGMAAFQAAAAKGLDPVISHLVKIRASQLNRCAFCLDMHTTEARKEGETQLRIDLLPAWEETPRLYNGRERAALALAEAMTVLTDGFVPDAVFEQAAKHFEEEELARLIAQIVAINAWNRFQVTIRATPASLADEAGS